MTDFRRPDLDLWEEEDAEDARPTIVSERPTSAPSAPAKKATKASDKTIPFGTVPGERKTPEVQRSSLVQRLIEQGALEDDGAARNSTEVLRDSEIELLKLPDESADDTVLEPMLELVTPAPSTALDTPRKAAAVREILGVESEAATEDQVPTVSVKRPLPPVSVELKSTMSVLPVAEPRPTPESRPAVQERPSSERDITERISIPPSGMVGSIAPASRTFRPAARERKGMPFWQTALAALVLLGGGISIAKFQAEQRNQTAVLSSQPVETQDDLSARPAPLAETIANPPAAAAPEPPAASAADIVAPRPAAPPPPVEQMLTPAVPAAAPANIGPMLPPKRDESIVPVSRTRRVREQRAIASAEPEASEEIDAPAPVAVATPKPAVKSSEPLPAHPSRDQVVASLNAISPELQRCVGDRHGVAEVTVTVRSGGFVSYAVVSGGYAGTSEGSCIARAVRAAKFPAFSDPMLRVTYPFQL